MKSAAKFAVVLVIRAGVENRARTGPSSAVNIFDCLQNGSPIMTP